TLPPGRNSIFKGIKNTTIIDSAYNANLDSMSAVLGMFDKIKAEKKWMILGDMLEQGNSEKQEHERLAEEISKVKYDKIILMGPRVSKYTFPKLITNNALPAGRQESRITNHEKVVKFINPDEVLKYLREHIKGEETILFKGARFLEGVVEHLLADKEDVKKLCRQEKVWRIRRRQWGL
ncbi:MAG: cyanophycin synthetase, partial [Candidatus Colwellbacteria bacterium]|nr:cyanophycin synthetase [Candidatus Colwellbacteria bacterium]